jgi:hypothetical protein
MHDQHVRLREHLRDRLKIAQRAVWQLAVQAFAHREGGRREHQRMTVGGRLGGDFRAHDADAIVDHDLLTPGFA